MKALQTPKIMWNGIKVNGKLYRVWYGFDRSSGVIHLTAKSYADGLPRLEGLEIRNDSRIEVDYFAHDKASVASDSPLFPAVLAAVLQYEARSREQASMRNAKVAHHEVTR
jgi:hypothetical protein